jgi:hypothetical protein
MTLPSERAAVPTGRSVDAKKSRTRPHTTFKTATAVQIPTHAYFSGFWAAAKAASREKSRRSALIMKISDSGHRPMSPSRRIR